MPRDPLPRPLLLPVALCLVALLVACRSEPAPDLPSLDPPAPAALSLAELRTQVEALEARLGPDAYRSAEIEPLILKLESFGGAEDESGAAAQLGLQLRARQRAARAATGKGGVVLPKGEASEGLALGKRAVDGPAPQEADRETVDSLRVGATREELLAALGSCLVRQTWFPGQRGGPTIELFQLTPSCRARFAPRVYSVANGKVVRIDEGNVDGLLEPSTDEREVAARDEPVPDDLPEDGADE